MAYLFLSFSLSIDAICCPRSPSPNAPSCSPGGYAKWKSLGIDQEYLPVWLQRLGYNTYYVGKVRGDEQAQVHGVPGTHHHFMASKVQGN